MLRGQVLVQTGPCGMPAVLPAGERVHVLTADPSLARCCASGRWGHMKPETPVPSAQEGLGPSFSDKLPSTDTVTRGLMFSPG